jgi:hypothetical protein
MTRQAAPRKKREKDVVRAAMRWFHSWQRAINWPTGGTRADEHDEKLMHACARLAQRKPGGK